MSENFEYLWREFYDGEFEGVVLRSFPGKLPFRLRRVSGNFMAVMCSSDEDGEYEKFKFAKDDISYAMHIIDEEEEEYILDAARFIDNSKFVERYETAKRRFLVPIALFFSDYVKSEAIIREPKHPMPEPDEIVEEPISGAELDLLSNELSTVRDVYWLPRLKNQYKKATAENKQQIDNISTSMASLDKSELGKWLKLKTNKRLVGASGTIDKLYVDRSSGNRLLWCFGDSFGSDFKNSVILCGFEKHDNQSAAGKKMPFVSRELIAICRAKQDQDKSMQSEIPPYRYVDGMLLPKLTPQQKELLWINFPATLKGCAGSGKTTVSIHIFKHLAEQGRNPYYLTFTPDLLCEVKKILRSEESVGYHFDGSRILTIKEFFLALLCDKTCPENKYVDFALFQKWKKSKYAYLKNGSKKIDDWKAWAFLRGVLKGGLHGTSANSIIISKEQFIKYLAQNEPAELEHAESYYEIADDYCQWCRSDNCVDDNDLAALALGAGKVVADCIVIDEVQDMTYRQIDAIDHCVKDHQIIMCGDDNQSINPTILDIDTIGSVFYKHNAIVEQKTLGRSFRSCTGIVRYVNYLSELRRKYIGTRGQSSEEQEQTIRTDESFWVTWCDNRRIEIHDVCAIAEEAANCIVIVPDETTKIGLMHRNPKLDGRIRTVFETKGLEYDNVIVCNFLYANEQVYQDIVEGEMNRSTYGRLMFNMMYVACTRASDRIVILDETQNRTLTDIFFKDIVKKTHINDVYRFMDLRVDDDGWLEEAERLLAIGDFRSARIAYQKIQNKDVSERVVYCTQKERLEAADGKNKETQINEYHEVGEKLLSVGDAPHAEEVYKTIFKKYAYEAMRVGLLKAILKQDKPVSSHLFSAFVNCRFFLADLEEDTHTVINLLLGIIEKNNKSINEIESYLSQGTLRMKGGRDGRE
jgi:hypothetical protein